MSQEFHLPIDVYSPDQSSTLLLELHSYANTVHEASIKARVSKKPVELPEISGALTNFLRSSGVELTDVSGLDALHKQFEAALKTAPTMHVTLSALPGRTLKRQLTVWFRTQVHPVSLLTFTARGDIGGGIILQAGSHLYDHSFRKQIRANPKRIGELAGV